MLSFPYACTHHYLGASKVYGEPNKRSNCQRRFGRHTSDGSKSCRNDNTQPCLAAEAENNQPQMGGGPVVGLRSRPEPLLVLGKLLATVRTCLAPRSRWWPEQLCLCLCCLLLAAGCVLLAACCWLRAAGCLLLAACCLLLAACCWLLAAGCLPHPLSY